MNVLLQHILKLNNICVYVLSFQAVSSFPTYPQNVMLSHRYSFSTSFLLDVMSLREFTILMALRII